MEDGSELIFFFKQAGEVMNGGGGGGIHSLPPASTCSEFSGGRERDEGDRGQRYPYLPREIIQWSRVCACAREWFEMSEGQGSEGQGRAG